VSKRSRGGLTVEDGQQEETEGMETGFRSSFQVNNGPVAEMIAIAIPDRPLCSIGVALLTKACERAHKALRVVSVTSEMVAKREADAAELQSRLDDETLMGLGLPVRLVPSLRVGLSIEYVKVQDSLEKQTELMLDTTDTETRVKALDRLMSALDMAQLGGETQE
jgi:hypothetical protein